MMVKHLSAYISKMWRDFCSVSLFFAKRFVSSMKLYCSKAGFKSLCTRKVPFVNLPCASFRTFDMLLTYSWPRLHAGIPTNNKCIVVWIKLLWYPKISFLSTCYPTKHAVKRSLPSINCGIRTQRSAAQAPELAPLFLCTNLVIWGKKFSRERSGQNVPR